MARAGQVVGETVTLAGHDARAAVAEVVAAVCEDPAYRASQTGDASAQVVRSIRPVWALVLGVPTSLLFGAGLLLLLVKRTESCTIVGVDGPTGAVITLDGRLQALRLAAVRGILGGGQLAATPAPASPAIAIPPTSWPGIPTLPPPTATPLTPAAPHREWTPLPLPPGDEGAAHTLLAGRSVGVASATGAVATPTMVARFDDGSSFAVRSFTLVGRDPRGMPEESDAVLVAIADPTMTVSKTHLSLTPRAGGVEVADRASANGTAFALPGGGPSSLFVGRPQLLPPGAKVRFGDRTFEICVGP